MLRLRSIRPNFRRQRRNFAQEAQQLEVRMVPTGVVTLAQTATGLKITGDVQSNRIQIDVLTTGATIQALDNDTVIRIGKVNYNPGSVVPIDNDASFVGNLTIDLKNGDDVLIVNIGDIEEEVPNIGDPPEIFLGDAPEVVIQGNLSINMGAGNDVAVVDIENGHLSVTGNATVDLGSGNDRLLAVPFNGLFSGGEGGLGFLEGFFGLGGDFPEDVDSVHEAVDFVVEEVGGMKVGGNLKVTAGVGDDAVGMIAVVAGRDLDVDLGGGNDLFGASFVGAGRELKLNAGSDNDDLALVGAYSGGKSTINMGAGNDIVLAIALESSRNVSMDMGAGDDVLLIAELITGPNALTDLNGNSGRDVIATETVERETLIGAGFDARTTVRNFESDEVSADVMEQLGEDFYDLFFLFD